MNVRKGLVGEEQALWEGHRRSLRVRIARMIIYTYETVREHI